MPDRSGKIGIVTGAGRGIGRANALACARAGGRVPIVDIAAELLEATAQLIREACGTVETMIGDASCRRFTVFSTLARDRPRRSVRQTTKVSPSLMQSSSRFITGRSIAVRLS